MEGVRKYFPILDQKIHGQSLIYLDNAATTQLPQPVMDCLSRHYCTEHANVHRGTHELSIKSTLAMERTRDHIKKFLNQNGGDDYEVVFTGGATDSLNLLAAGMQNDICPGDEIIVSTLEHHANFVPWQQLCMEKNAVLKVVPVKSHKKGEGFDMELYEQMLSKKTKIVAVTQVSNLTGEILPINEIAVRAKKYQACVIVDGAQGIRKFDFQEIGDNCDFYCFSTHKMFGPVGVGVIYGRKQFLERLKPMRYGGGMVRRVSVQSTEFEEIPYKLEAGTLNFPGIIAFDETMSFLEKIGLDKICEIEDSLTEYLCHKLGIFQEVQILADSEKQRGIDNTGFSHIVSFNFAGIDDFDLSCFLDHLGIAVRQGKHCAHPGMYAYGLESVIRVSPAFYNTFEEIDVFIDALDKARKFLIRR